MAEEAIQKPQVGIQAKGNLTVNDLTSKYQAKIDNYNNMIATMDDAKKKLFQTAINICDIQLRQNRWEEYVGYALNTLARDGFYYDIVNGEWKTCTPKESFINPNPQEHDEEEAYRRYLRTLYPREACSLMGISSWDIIDANVNMNLVKKANSGEMSYEYYDIELTTDIGGEQKGAKQNPNVIQHPNIPISPKANIEEMTQGDTSTDKFIYAYTDSGISKNNRNWRPMIMDRIAQQVMDNMPPGNLGHVRPKDVGYELPLPVVTWIGAMTEQLPDGINKRLWLKGYVIPVEKGNQLKTFIKAKAINSISVFGGLTLLPNQETGVSDVLDIDLKSIDISGKLKEGLNSGITQLAGEQFVPNEQSNKEPKNIKEEAKEMTLQELKTQHPQLAGEMRAEIIASMETEANQKVVMTKAGEMDAIVSIVGENNATETVTNLKNFAGEMASAVGLEMPTIELPTLSAIVEKAKEAFANISKVAEAIKPAEGQTVVEKAEEIAHAQQMQANQQAIDSVNAKYAELTKDITNENIKNLVNMQFQGILNTKPEQVTDTFATDAIQMLEANVPTAIETVTQNTQAILQSSQSAGEMALYDNLGTGKGVQTNTQKSYDEMTDEEYARSLGYDI